MKKPDVCSLSILLSVLSGPWTMYILWILATSGAIRFGALKRQVEGISTKVLTERLRMLEAEGIIYRHQENTIPPRVTYGLTERGQELIDILRQLNTLAERWYPQNSYGCWQLPENNSSPHPHSPHTQRG